MEIFNNINFAKKVNVFIVIKINAQIIDILLLKRNLLRHITIKEI